VAMMIVMILIQMMMVVVVLDIVVRIYFMNKEYIISKLQELKPQYSIEGLDIIGIFGSYAKNKETNNSDIDILYKLDAKRFYSFHDGFKSFSRIASIQNELCNIFNKDIDLCTINQNNELFKQYALKDIVYV
jgi:predicted nucleotidyltransferase